MNCPLVVVWPEKGQNQVSTLTSQAQTEQCGLWTEVFQGCQLAVF